MQFDGIKRVLKKTFCKRKRQKLTMLFAVYTVYILMLAGTFSYFHSEDAVTNRIAAKNGSVKIQEPAWDSKGQAMAQKSEPGMTIPKDPSGYNDGQVDLYVRLKMTVELGRYEGNLSGTDTDDGNVGKPTDEKRLKAIIEAIKNENDEQFITLNTAGTVSGWKIAGWNNTGFVAEETNYSAADDDDGNDNNTLIFYFYYTGGDKDDSGAPVMRVVRPEESTAELFDHLDIPIYKKDYLGVFDQQYRITLQAEGIPAREGESLTAAAASAKFAEENQ